MADLHLNILDNIYEDLFIILKHSVCNFPLTGSLPDNDKETMIGDRGNYFGNGAW